MRKLKLGRYDYAAFCVFISYAAASMAVPIVLVAMAKDLGFPLDGGGMADGGWLQMLRSIGICTTMVLCIFIAALFGNRRPLGISVMVIGFGMLVCTVAPGYGVLIFALALCGLGEGIVEGLATPFVQGLHEEEPGRYVNFAHGFWCVGVVLATVLFGAMLAWGCSWRMVLLVAAFFALPGILLIFWPGRKPCIEKREEVSKIEVLRRARAVVTVPRFWIFFAAMFLAGGGEFCLTFWVASFVQLNFASTAMMGGIATAIFALGMFLGRTGAGILVPHSRLRELVLGTGVLATFVSLSIPWLSEISSQWSHGVVLGIFFLVLFVLGIGVAPFWPSIQSYSVDCMPALDTTTVFVLLSCAGVPGCGFFTLLMGYIGNAHGLACSFYLVPACFAVMSLLVACTPSRCSAEKKGEDHIPTE